MRFKDFSDTQLNVILKHLQLYQNFLEKHQDAFQLNHIEETLTFNIDLNLFKNDTEFIQLWPDFLAEITTNSEEYLSCIGLAMHQIIVENKIKFTEASIEELPLIIARIINNEPVLNVRDLKVEYYGKLVTVCGTVIKSTYKKLQCTWMAFKCSKCSFAQAVKQIEHKFTPPRKCLLTGCKKTTDFIPILTSPHTKTVEQQLIKIQELFDGETVN